MPYKNKSSELARKKAVEAQTRYRQKNKDKINQNIKELKQKKKQQLIEHLGGKCVGCGTTEYLQFDHIVRADKSFTIGQNMHKSLDVLIEEANKCQLLCKKCHEFKGICYNDYHKLAEGYRITGVERIDDKIIVTLEPCISTIKR